MKQMNEVFDLPVIGELNCGEPFLADSDFYFASFDDELSYADGKGLERAIHAAHAINHVDALADALADLLNEIYSGGATRYTAEVAAQELAAYRGEK